MQSSTATSKKKGDPKPVINAKEQLGKRLSDTKAALARLSQTNPSSLFEIDGLAMVLDKTDNGLKSKLLTIESALVELDNAASWVKSDSKGNSYSIDPPEDIARHIIDRPKEFLRNLKAICQAPILARDSASVSWVTKQGYNEDTRIYHAYSPGLEGLELDLPSDLSEAASRVAPAARLLSEGLLGEFRFSSPADKANALAMILLPFVIHAIGAATPIHLVEAPENNSGKSTLVQLASIIATGKDADVIAINNKSDNDSFNKLLMAKLITKPATIFIDNVSFRLDSAKLCSVVTELKNSDRVLGITKMIDVNAMGVCWVITANAPNLSDEVARRCISIKLVGSVDGVKFSRDVKQWAKENRAQLVKACLDIVNYWLLLGRPLGSIEVSSFQEWSRALGGILTAAGVDSFLDNYRSRQRDYDSKEKDLVKFYNSWAAYGASESMGRDLFTLAKTNELFTTELSGSSENSQFGQFIALIRGQVGRTINGCRIETRYNKDSKTDRYCLIVSSEHSPSN